MSEEQAVSISKLVVPERVVEFEYPDIEGFKLLLCFISRDKIAKMRSKCTSPQFNRKNKQTEEKLDEDLFNKLYSEAVIKDWHGLKASHLEELLLVNTSGLDPDTEIKYTKDNAAELMKNSVEFDRWVVETVNNLANFSIDKSSE